MRFTWHESKRRSNLVKHGLDFADAARVFDCLMVFLADKRYNYGELA